MALHNTIHTPALGVPVFTFTL